MHLIISCIIFSMVTGMELDSYFENLEEWHKRETHRYELLRQGIKIGVYGPPGDSGYSDEYINNEYQKWKICKYGNQTDTDKSYSIVRYNTHNIFNPFCIITYPIGWTVYFITWPFI